MASVDISDSVLKSAAQLLYNKGPLKLDVPKTNMIVSGVLNTLGLPKGPAEVALTEVPTVTISQSGVSVSMKARAQSSVPPVKPALPVTFRGTIKLDLKGDRLILVSRSTSCKVRPETVKGKLMKKVVNLVINRKLQDLIDNRFDGGIKIVPAGVDFTNSKINYHDGRVEVRGNLSVMPHLIQEVMTQLMANINKI